jgi:hypothetical protein
MFFTEIETSNGTLNVLENSLLRSAGNELKDLLNTFLCKDRDVTYLFLKFENCPKF